MTEPHCIWVLELESTDDPLKAVISLLRGRSVVITEQITLQSGRILLDCQVEPADRFYRITLLMLLIPGVTSVERLISKGVMKKENLKLTR